MAYRGDSRAVSARNSGDPLLRQIIIGGTALSSVVLACVAFVCVNPFSAEFEPSRIAYTPPAAQPKQVAAVAVETTASVALKQPPAAAAASPAPQADGMTLASAESRLVDPSVTVAMLDPAFSRVARSNAFSSPEPSDFSDRFMPPMPLPQAEAPPKPAAPKPEVAQAPPAPARRPVQMASLTPPASRPVEPAPKPSREQTQAMKVRAAAEKIFEKALGKQDNAPAVALAYAAPDGGIPGISAAPKLSTGYDNYTAVYDIKAATVYMPDGTTLEAHSGNGTYKDDPRYAHVRMRGVTPPHVYDLKLRETLFHGVRAIRMTPVGGDRAIFGRTGILAHSYLLGPRGDSHGCVSFKNYNAFLQAYLRGDVKRLVVVGSVE